MFFVLEMMFLLDRISNYGMSNDLPEKHTPENEGKVGLLPVKEPSRREIAWRITQDLRNLYTSPDLARE